MALKTYNPVHAEPAPAGAGRPFRPVPRQAGQDADRGQELERRAQQQRPHHRAVFRGGRPQAGLIAPSISSGGKLTVPAAVERIEYDPNRTAFIALLKYQDGDLRLYPWRRSAWRPADTIVAGEHVDVSRAMPSARQHPDRHHRAQYRASRWARAARSRRSAGTYAQIVGRDQDYVIMPG